ncbi:hypothetical protein R70723_07425 [Paenibacillus sp. FSL R7-0273]|uniref:hypothetical protein n=1 Tax=Paenibacillus sp. FSL R7-0273 TaxID=1536772 RepID=UPI0004F60DF2|nr:hypothetical protein [Paenibacillus sp. FSL R7-0273]AIQ45736.1 hypothetical protein R70723_07425 [Paenibacillus sp. FSL R7-0273]OMF95258.1 hypothetical protein BK144_06935 [Paenibacillus sp. FSL R7-0273]
MSGSLIYISSLQPIEIEFDDALQKEKYACFFAPDIKIIGSKIRLLAIPYGRGVRWFLAQEIENDEEVATLTIIDGDTLKGKPTNKVITLPLRENGLLDNTRYHFYGDVDRDSGDLKMIEAIRKNSMYEYSFYQSHKDIFTITPRKSEAKF